ncbi:hypothetical protein UFOVP7_41 [uncultured Caudovirales phage]|uniref:Tail fiber protein n=1 Tax=uncultured Caudovirales phage TaxID=2100421 RepID=A0A6J5KHT8_9CAUD|nr:hypothetical protein UFOVP7_41 [uncultured Caudovirales phage]
MTVSSQVSRADYNGNGVTTLFSVPFYFVDPTHLTVLSTVIATGVSTVLTLATNYTVSGTGVSTGGSITMLSAPAGTVRITILRNVPYLQNTHYVPNDPFPATSHEAALDLLTMEAQQINEILSRTVTFPSSDPTGIGATIPNAVARAGKVFTFDSTGAPSVTNNAVDVTAVAANAANINTVSANIASVNSVAGNATNINTVATNNTNVSTVATNIASINTNTANITAIQNASANATAAASSASSASTSAGTATTQAGVATTQAGNAATSATAAAGSATSAATNLASFKNAYYGPLATNPTTRPDSTAMQAGDEYYNTSSKLLQVYNGTSWGAAGVVFNPIQQSFSGTGSQTAFTLSQAPGVAAALVVTIGGVGQTAGTDFTLSGTTLTFTTAPVAGTNNINVVNFGVAGSIAVPANNSITAAMIQAGAIAGNLGYTPLNPANNLSDVANAATARNNLGVRAGITTVLLSTASPNATLTAASNQYIRVTLDTTTPYAPSITMPDMTTLPVGQGYFVISNETGMPLAMKDSGGTIREFLPANGEYQINITSVATATGVWYFNNSPVLVGDSQALSTFIPRSSYMANTALAFNGYNYLVTLDSTNFALVWAEQSTNNVYAKLFTVNSSTGAFTLGNRVTVTTGSSTGYFDWDTDNAGHALIGFVGSNALSTCGLSVSGGTLYASAVNSIGFGAGASVQNINVAYLGSNSAYAVICQHDTGACTAAATAIRGCTVTGTTTVTMTQSASNSDVAATGNAVRTSLTTFIAGSNYVSYTPASNTYTKGARTTQTQAEQWIGNRATSFGSSGWQYCNGKILAYGYVFDITNAGAAGVTANLSTSYSIKPSISSNYAVISNGISAIPVSSAFVSSSSKILSVGSPNLVYGVPNSRLMQADQSSSTFNINVSGIPNGEITTAIPQSSYSRGIILSANNAVFATTIGASPNESIALLYAPLATSIV